MKVIALLSISGLLAVTGALAGTINYNTTGSTLSCNGVAGCVQNTTTSVTIGGLTFTYNSGSGSNVVTPSIINLGNIVSTGTGTSVNVTGLRLTINVNSTPPGASGTLPNGAVSGSVSTNNSGATILFGPNNTTTGFGTLPGVTISGGGVSFTYQVLNPTLGLQAPTVGNPVGQTSIQGAVTDTSSGQTMTANTGTTPQSTTVSTAFTNALAVTLKDAANSPISGASVTFTAPASGASGLFSNSTTTITAQTNASGVASATFTANSTAGSYSASAAASGFTNVNFSLTNTAGAAASMTANAGTTPQTTSVNSLFGASLAVTVTDAGLNPLSGVSVTFTAPASGASGLFSNSTTTITVMTSPSGVASAPFTANGIAGGPYTVSAAASGLSNVNFSLINATVYAPTLSKAFGASRLYYGTGSDATSLTFTVGNPAANLGSLTNISFTDTLPAGLVVAIPSGLTGACGGGTISATSGSSLISLSGATLTPGNSCTFSVQVRGVGFGPQVNITSAVTADGGLSGTPAAATIVVSNLIYYWFFA